MTSNLGSKFLKDKSAHVGFLSKEDTEKDFNDRKTVIMNEVKRTFRPEFINRIDEMIVFHPLNKESLGAILKLLLKDVEKKIQHLHLSLDISEDAQEALISSGTDLEYGARPLRLSLIHISEPTRLL